MNDQSLEGYIAGQDLFSGLDGEYISWLAACAKPIEIGQNEVLFRQDEIAEAFYIVREGRISVEIPAIYGPSLTVQTMGPGEILGWSWLIPPYGWDFQAKAEEDSVLVAFDGKAVLAHCEEDPKFGYQIVKRFAGLMGGRLDSARRKMMDEWNPSGFA